MTEKLKLKQELDYKEERLKDLEIIASKYGEFHLKTQEEAEELSNFLNEVYDFAYRKGKALSLN